MLFEQLRVGGDRNFAYLVGDTETREALVVDPGPGPGVVIDRARELGFELRLVLNTHGHPDHSGGNAPVMQRTGARLAAFGHGDIPLADGDALRLGTLQVRVMYTPGHTRDSICFHVGENLVTGDTLFVGKVGGTGDEESARLEYHSLHEKVCSLPPGTLVWPGHDYGVRPSSTIGEELRSNPFLLCGDFAAFLHLKQNWTEYKRTHGIA